MTLVLAWPNREENPTALHIATDSLLSDELGNRWQYVPKINRVHLLHEFTGFCGTSNLVMAAILQCTSVLAAADVLGSGGSSREATLDARIRALVPFLDNAIRTFPKDWLAKGTNTLLYCGVDHRKVQFRLFEIDLSKSGASFKEKALSKQHVVCYGTGAVEARSLLAGLKLANTTLSTSDVLNVLKTVIEDKSIPSVGGAPQMVTITKRSSRLVGFNWEVAGKLESTLLGLPLHFRSSMTKIKFLDQQFRKSSYLHNSRLRREVR
jgi:hypothetical protein